MLCIKDVHIRKTHHFDIVTVSQTETSSQCFCLFMQTLADEIFALAGK